MNDALPPGEVKARIAYGAHFGTFGWAADPLRYVALMPPRVRNRKRCPCGCGQKASHSGISNGLAMTYGCELSMRRWTKTPHRMPPPFEHLGDVIDR